MRRSKNRDSLLLPIAIPLGILAVIGLVLFGYSRVLLSTSQTAATVIALITAASILGVATFLSGRPRVTGSLMFSMIAAVGGIAMVAGGIAVAIGPGKEAAPPVPAQKVSISASVGASAKGFDQKTLTWGADAPVTLVFDNKDTIAHNVYIAASKQSAGTPLFAGSTVNGGVQFPYQVPKLAAGGYYFFCNIHPTTMNGSLTVTPGGGGVSVTVAAHNLAFNTDKIQLTSGAPSSITFENQDPGTQHNIGIYQDANFSTEIFKGQIIAGPNSIVYHPPPLAAGTYYFKCDVHPTMKGTVIVGASAPASPSASASAGSSATPSAAASASVSASATP